MCHCLECQRRTGAVISNQARFRREQITFAGKSTAWTRTAESGNALTFHFCPTCGSTVYWEGQGFPGYVAVPSAPLTTQISPGPRSRCGKSQDIPGSLSHPTRHPSACQSRAEAVAYQCRGAWLAGKREIATWTEPTRPHAPNLGRRKCIAGAAGNNSYRK